MRRDCLKRVGNLFDSIIEYDNLKLAFYRAAYGKASRGDVIEYRERLTDELRKLRSGLKDGSYSIGKYRRFKIYEPKERTICAAAFRERVLHHALMNVCGPYFDKWLVERTYACRKGMGQFRAIEKAMEYSRRYRYFLKCDIRKYFDTIPHSVLMERLEKKIKDKFVLMWFQKIVSSYHTANGFGLPMGNLTSQYFANFYLDDLDRLPCLAGLGYVRYMDDFIVWADDVETLKNVLKQITKCLHDNLKLEMKEIPYINCTKFGIEFLGRRITPVGVSVIRRKRISTQRKIAALEKMFASGLIDETILQERTTAFCATEKILRRYGNRRVAVGSSRIHRGGSWNNEAHNCRSSQRNRNDAGNRWNNIGFRLSCSAAPQDGTPAVPAEIRFPDNAGTNLLDQSALVEASASKITGGGLKIIQSRGDSLTTVI